MEVSGLHYQYGYTPPDQRWSFSLCDHCLLGVPDLTDLLHIFAEYRILLVNGVLRNSIHMSEKNCKFWGLQCNLKSATCLLYNGFLVGEIHCKIRARGG